MKAPAIHYILKDHLGSWTTITDAEGTVEQEHSMQKNPCAIEWKPLPLSPETKGRSHGSHSKHKGIANPPTRHQRIANSLELG